MIFEVYPESFCSENLAIRKVFAFFDSVAKSPTGESTAQCVQGCCGMLVIQKGPRGMFWAKIAHFGPPNPPKKCFLSRKRPKEDEIVAGGHFHWKSGYENFGTRGSKKSLFVSEIRPFEVGIVVRRNFTCKIWTLLINTGFTRA